MSETPTLTQNTSVEQTPYTDNVISFAEYRHGITSPEQRRQQERADQARIDLYAPDSPFEDRAEVLVATVEAVQEPLTREEELERIMMRMSDTELHLYFENVSKGVSAMRRLAA